MVEACASVETSNMVITAAARAGSATVLTRPARSRRFSLSSARSNSVEAVIQLM